MAELLAASEAGELHTVRRLLEEGRADDEREDLPREGDGLLPDGLRIADVALEHLAKWHRRRVVLLLLL